MLFTVLVLFTLVCFFVFTIHIGQRFTHKVEMQNAADAAAISGAVWKARGFNLISILNVSMSECLALIIMLKSFDSTLTITKIAHRINLAAATACCSTGVGAACCGIAEILNLYTPILRGYSLANNVMKRAWKSPKILWKLMKGLKSTSKLVSKGTAIMAYVDASTIAGMNGASAFGEVRIKEITLGVHAVLWPLQYELPVKDKVESFQEQLCTHALNGGDGYKNYLCYDNAFDIGFGGMPVDDMIRSAWAILSVIVPTPVLTYEVMKKYHYDELCSTQGVSQDMANYLPSTVQCDVCSRERGKALWTGERIELNRGICNDSFKKEGTTGIALDPITISNGGSPGGVLLDNGVDNTYANRGGGAYKESLPCRVCNNFTVIKPPDPNHENSPASRRYFADIWTLSKCTLEVDQSAISIGPQNIKNDKVPPLVLADNWQEEVKYTSLVFKKENTAEGSYFRGADGNPILSLESNMSGEIITYGKDGESKIKSGERVKIPERTWAVARSEVYNPGEQDLFNQNWHAKLAPVDVKGIQTEFLGLEIPLPDKLKNLMNNAVEEVWAH